MASPPPPPSPQLPMPSKQQPSSTVDLDGLTKGRSPAELALVMLALCLSLFLAALDMSIVSTALPVIISDFKAPGGYVWVGSAYLLGNAAFVPTWGKISDIFGRKLILIVCVVIFWIGSLLCAVSVNMTMLVAARALQGCGAGGLVTLPNIVVSDLASPRNRALLFGVFGAVWAIASAVGPLVGGLFTSRLSWRWCFYINLPFGAASLAILVFVLKLHNPRTPVKAGLVAIDWVGSVLVIGGTLMLLLGLEFGGVQYSWRSPTVLCLILFGILTIALFVLYEAVAAEYPIIPLSLFRHRNSAAVYALSYMHAFAFFGGSYWLPLYFQAVTGVGPLLSGVYLLPFVLSLSLTSVVIGIFNKKSGLYKLPITGGLAVMTVGLGLMTTLGVDRNWAKIILFQIIAGVGTGPNFTAPLVALHTNIEPRDIGSATASYSFLRQLGTSTSVAVGGVIFANVMTAQHDALVRTVGAPLADRFGSDQATANVFAVRDLPLGDRLVIQEAYWNALQKMFIVYAAAACTGFLISFLVQQKKLSKSHLEHKTGLASLKHRNEGKEPAMDEEKTAAP
ncbi:hypothetical protein RJ55_04947 [Drechmeria coniospora]|nr:hypothetical protein RJ55_04947 [Drechmeria coniospora]